MSGGLSESCSVCGRTFEVQFRYQMEERSAEGGASFAFFCSQKCHAASLRGDDGAVVCDGCHKQFKVELVAQVLHVKGNRRYACGDACRAQLIAESEGRRLGQLVAASETETATGSETESVATTATATETASEAEYVPPVLRPAFAAPKRKLGVPRRLAVFNHKGGTGKTTTSVSIAAGLAAQGLRVLLVDTDSQGNVAVSLGVKAERSLYHVLVMGLAPSAAAVNVRPNLDLIASNETLAAAELYLAGRQNRDRILRERLEKTDDYDVVVLDCSPSLSLLNQNALVFADGVLVPVACDFLSLVGVRQVIKTIKNVNSLLHHPVQIWGVLPTFYDARARICRDALETLQKHFGERCLPPIRQATRVKEAPASAKTIFEHAPDSNAAADYGAIVERMMSQPAAAQSPLAATA
jgi:chromosome partitioning protein